MKSGWRLYWARFVCEYILGHDHEDYVKGSFELRCRRCGQVDRI